MPTWQVERSGSGEVITSFNPYTVKIKKYGKSFITEAKSFAARTIETKQLSANPFSNRTEQNAKSLTGIRYVAPASVAYGDEINTSWALTGQLLSYPVVQSEFFALFANGTKLVENTNYTINYATGAITFLNDMTGREIRPVYSHGGNITLYNGATSCYTMRDVYDYMQANLSDVITTVDGVAYTFYVDFIIGNYSTTQGCILDPDASIVFEDGYTYAFSVAGGFIDLAGITAGSGTGGTSGGGLPLNIFDNVGTTYAPGSIVDIYSTTLDSSGNLVNSTVNITVYYPNSSIVSNGISATQTTGRFKYNFTLPASAPEGTYRVDIDASYLTYEVHDNLAFKVAVAGNGSANPEVLVDAPDVININTYFDITALTKSSSGIAADCDSTPTVIIRDTLAGANVVSSASMTKFATGQYNYTWLTANQSTYLATVSCTISGTAYTGAAGFSTQNVPSGTPSVQIAGPSVVNINTDFGISGLIKDANNALVNCTGNALLTLKDNTDGSSLLSGVAMTLTETGKYNYTTSLPSQSTYLATMTCTVNSVSYTSNALVISSQNVPGAGGSGSAYPTIELSASTPISTLSTASVSALVKSSNGTITNCDGNLGLTIRDLQGDSVTSSNMTNLGTGIYNYSWSTPATASVFLVNASCTISSTSYTGMTLVSTQATGATATVDYNQIATFVWNYTSRNLTYYNQSVAESLQSCLRDGSCANWWINTTMANIYNTVISVNSTVDSVLADTQQVINSLNCTEQVGICTRLQDVLNNATSIRSIVFTMNTSQLPALQTIINNVYTNTLYIRDNMSTQANTTDILNRLSDIDSNMTYVKNNMFYQGNATGAFIVDYLATVYVEAGYNASLWILTSDLLGNPKTVSAAECNILQNGASVANATDSISAGGVYVSWNIPSAQSSGTYHWNCTLTGSTVNLQVPFFIASPTATSTSLYNVRISDFGELAQGEQYRAKVWITDYLGAPKNADYNPRISLYDPARNLMLDNISMNADETGIYSYNFTTTSSQTDGVWETVVSVTVNGVTTRHGDYWELESSPAEVTIIAVTDTEIPEITASAKITNEGSAAYEYHYEYCVVSAQDNSCGGSDDHCYGLGAKLLNPAESWTTSLTCSNAFTAGANYYFKVLVHYGTEASGASKLFTATAPSVSPVVTPVSGGGGGGGGFRPATKPSVEEEIEAPGAARPERGIYPAFNITVPEEYRTIAVGGSIVQAEITAKNITDKIYGVVTRMKFLTIDEQLIVSEYDTKDMSPDKPITKRLRVPEWVTIGKYLLRVEVTYLNETTEEDFEIELVLKEEKPSEIVVYIKELRHYFIIGGIILLILIILILIILAVIIINRRRERTRPFRTRFRPQIREEPRESSLNTGKPFIKWAEQPVRYVKYKPKKSELHNIIKHMKRDMPNEKTKR
ncbi:MAG: hypothetical protein V1906_00080 [Candidatus Woesearchaeota archaeon]